MSLPLNHLKDLRSYIAALAEIGDLREIGWEADPHLEMAAFTRRGYEVGAPAPLFTNIKGTAQGMRALGAPAARSVAPGMPAARLALSLGLPPESTWVEIVDVLAKAVNNAPIPPVVVESGPCQENILIGDEVDLDLFPIPLLHGGDGGPYANTWGTIIVQTPDGSWTNWSIARIQKTGKREMVGLIGPGQHVGRIWQMWADLGRPMPFAVVQGCEPAIPIASGMKLPLNVDEAGYLGGYFGEALELVKCQTNDLLVPATAEIVIEGHLTATRTAYEGPFGEYAGYVNANEEPQPIYQIEAITYRDNAIWPFVPEGRPVDEYHTVTGISWSALALNLLREAGLPVTAAFAPVEMANFWLVVTVNSDWREKTGLSSPHLTYQIADVIWKSSLTWHFPEIFVMDDDIDPGNIADVNWAIPTRTHPGERRIEKDGLILHLVSNYTDKEKAAMKGVHIAHDCLFDEPKPEISSFMGTYPEEIRRRVLERWDQG